jgi:hypothetical protein
VVLKGPFEHVLVDLGRTDDQTKREYEMTPPGDEAPSAE